MELVNVRNIFVYSNENKARKIMDSKNHFADINNFFLRNYFTKEKVCFGVLVISKNGAYQKKSGEYLQEDILKLMINLN